MRPVHRTRLAILLAIALVAPAAANDSGEIWITAQSTSELKILSGNGHIETIPLPAEAQPHTITFSPPTGLTPTCPISATATCWSCARKTGKGSRSRTLTWRASTERFATSACHHLLLTTPSLDHHIPSSSTRPRATLLLSK